MGKRAQKRAMEGWENVILHRPQTRPDTSGRTSIPVIGVEKEGSWLYFPNIGAAAKWICGNRENVRRCCRENKKRHVNKRTGKVNTDHQYMGIRFYFEEDSIWANKITKT